MAAAPVNLMNAGHFYSNIAKPVDINLNFIVDSTNGNGLGIRSLKSNGYVKNVYMATSASPAVGSPNPQAGYALIQLAGNYNVYIGGFSGQVIPLASTGLTSTTATHPYVITSLGTTTLAQWQAAGVPLGFVPAVGLSFIAKASGAIGGTATVGAPGVPSTTVVSVVGDPNKTIANSNSSANSGMQLLIQFSAATNSSTTTLIAAAPADGTVIGMTIRLDASSTTVDGL